MCVCVCVCLSTRLYGTKCAGCNTGLCPEDMVRRAVDKVYHLACFVCSLCRKELQTGEQLFLVQVRGMDRCPVGGQDLHVHALFAYCGT